MIWQNCYESGWQGEIVPEAFAHPAKFSRALIRRIYDHALEEGWLAPGMTVVDPFGGVALGALDAMWNGLDYLGIELEPKFVKLGQANIALWQRKYGSKEEFGSARIIQGDSRNLASVIAGTDCCIGSPPFMECGTGADKEPHNRQVITSGKPTHAKNAVIGNTNYGSSPGQLGAMKEGDFDCVVGSPPFAQAQTGGGISAAMRGQGKYKVTTSLPSSCYQPSEQGESPGQLASLPEGRFAEIIISSPPFMSSDNRDVQEKFAYKFRGDQRYADTDPVNSTRGGDRLSTNAKTAQAKRVAGTLNLGHIVQSGNDGTFINTDTFWSAAREILIQCHAILRPGGHAIWVCKDFIRKGRRVPFSDQWQALCESVGFRLVCRHKAMLVKIHGEQETIFNGTEELKTERKGFFRRLAEKKGSPAIDWEDILCCEKS